MLQHTYLHLEIQYKSSWCKSSGRGQCFRNRESAYQIHSPGARGKTVSIRKFGDFLELKLFFIIFLEKHQLRFELV